MINVYILKKWGALILACVLPANIYMISFSMFGLMGGLIGLGVAVLISIIFANLLLANPFSAVLEGKGLLVIPLDSTGLAHPVIVRLDSKTNKLDSVNNQTEMSDVFDRDIAFNMVPPLEAKTSEVKINQIDGNVEIKISSADYNKSKFGMLQYPLLFWNKRLGSFITKDQMSNMEKNMLTAHPIYRYNLTTIEMQREIRDLSRGIVDVALKPEKKNDFLSSPWMILIVVVFIAVLLFMFLPKIMPQFAQGLGSITKSLAP